MRMRSGSSSGVERKLPKLDVAGSTPVSRSNTKLLSINDLRDKTYSLNSPCFGGKYFFDPELTQSEVQNERFGCFFGLN